MSHASSTVADAARVTTSGRGTMTSRTSVSPNSNTRESIARSSASRTPVSSDSANRSLSSSSECARPAVVGGGSPRRRVTSRDSHSSSAMNGRKTALKARTGPTVMSATCSERTRLSVFGTISPSTTVMAVTIAKASAVATRVLTTRVETSPSGPAAVSKQPPDRRLAHGTGRERRHGDRHLHRRDEAGRIALQVEHQRRPARPAGDELGEARRTRRHERVLRGDEERVPRDDHGEGGDADPGAHAWTALTSGMGGGGFEPP